MSENRRGDFLTHTVGRCIGQLMVRITLLATVSWKLFSGLRPLRSAERRVCHAPRQNSTFGDRSFAAAGPRTGLSLTTFNEHYFDKKAQLTL